MQSVWMRSTCLCRGPWLTAALLSSVLTLWWVCNTQLCNTCKFAIIRILILRTNTSTNDKLQFARITWRKCIIIWCTYIYVCTYTSIYVYTNTVDAVMGMMMWCRFMYVCVRIYLSIYIYIYVHIYTFVYIYIPTFVNTYIPTYTFTYRYVY